MESVWSDIQFAWRALYKERPFAVVATLTLALGICATTTIAGIVRSVLVRALPFADSDSLVFLLETVGSGVGSVSYPNYLDWRAQNSVFTDLAAYSSSDLTISSTGTAAAERIYGEVVTDSYLPLLHIRPMLGRNFSVEENRNPSAHPVAIISNGLRSRKFGRNTSVLGQTIKVNESTFTIVGVTPDGFSGVTARADVWIPLSMRDLLWPQSAQFHFNSQRDIHWHRVLGRLRPEVNLDRARREMTTIGGRLSQEYPQANKERGIQVIPASEAYLGRLRSPLLLLLGAAGFILLVSCFNSANLFLIRAAGRGSEMVIRAWLGAGRRRLAQQWITEATLIAMAGGTLGFLLASWSIGPVVRILPVRLPAFARVQLDLQVFAFSAGLSILTGVLLGFVGAQKASQGEVAGALRQTRTSSVNRQSFQSGNLLVMGEIALAVIVAVGAGLLFRSFQELRRADPGFESDHLVMARFDVPAKTYTGEARLRAGPQIMERVSSLPEVRSAALTIVDPFVWSGINRGITLEGHAPLSASEQDDIYVQEISPDYFGTMKIPILAGRDFTMRDNSGAPHVVIVSRAFARRYWPGQPAVGKRIKYGPANSNYGWMEIVGEVGDVRFSSLRADPNSSFVIYAPLTQSEVIVSMTVVARTKTEPTNVAGAVREAIQQFDSQIPVYSVATMVERIEGETDTTRSFAILLALFALIGSVLAAVGAYAAMSAQISGRTREIGIRMALGAQPGRVLRMILSYGARIAVYGVALGLAGCLWATRLLSAQLYGIPPTDPLTFAAAATLFCAIGIAACWAPARRAMRVDPTTALRNE